MTGALILLAIVVAVGLVLYVSHRISLRKGGGTSASDEIVEPEQACCGMHIVCEKNLPIDRKGNIIYYDDEELDSYAYADPEQYTDSDVEQFRDILLTLLPEDIAGWNKSLELRHIPLPEAVRDEMLMIVGEMRQTLNEAK